MEPLLCPRYCAEAAQPAPSANVAGAPHRPMQPVPQLQPHQHRRAPSAIQAAALEYAAQRRQQVQHQRREEVLAWRQHRDASLSSSGSG
ncbi:hypothetical protein CHLNCDRAFT_136736 [Chlorella variabilis]|uniref:Uncharacterized protein n=1 Tax=Chlorella variabilis TaxID=554065 RepID=E1ZKY9_CHLVA|nr:hypothetical protein CHLNCDRAFT_136736 [Chlorella variabilis]EFN53464.1 hypothetical protein CHLNCDRAFT_136736 [Chlorella variabilis]|eukprot:XP_005845566.1 hypothetical protein CHLNCDRAFT_136736 [Chlorella variabilis]